ncbi:hypothetical protein CsSME_00049033 [Camellia sinensis var. sinensis]
MELFYISISLVSLSIILILIVFLSPSKAKNLPPGKTGWPVIGESIEYLAAGWKGQPEKFIFEQISNYTSYIFKTNLMLQPTVVFCGAPAHKFLSPTKTSCFSHGGLARSTRSSHLLAKHRPKRRLSR